MGINREAWEKMKEALNREQTNTGKTKALIGAFPRLCDFFPKLLHRGRSYMPVKVVVDSSIIIAALAARGLCSSIFELCLLDHRVILSEELLRGIAKNLSKKVKVPSAVVAEIISLLRKQSQIAKPKKMSKQVSREYDDDAVPGLAVAVGADCIISGDKDLLCLKEFHEIPILSPREFRDILRKTKE